MEDNSEDRTLLDTEPEAHEPNTLEVGKPFHGLIIHSLLGKGAMGEAYLASHPVLQTPLVVIIVLKNSQESGVWSLESKKNISFF